ncbi:MULTISPECIES: hypothetical protein [unclassified Devosia]|uniref:hypothetical protein n=1 Tax=unclassified Devosia TaxID=196773 RepID=UPI00145CDD43|nr:MULTISPECIES: hypothetical protein [unclassified Devosia]MBJ6986567.1 hypothetical protein [Devosia sp. MC521]QMW61612.1 hypothetical protein H4N61_11595 [Devosia sp. MC521]
MTRQQVAPILVTADTAISLPSLDISKGESGFDEAKIQDLIHRFPGCLPIREIDPAYSDPIAICRELSTRAGPIDNFLVTASGLPVLVECKLWRNPEGRRKVVGQILDYAKELTHWTSSDVEREVSRRIGADGITLLDRVRVHAPNVDEIAFNDSLSRNLRRGRFLLLIVGDGIREGVEAIAEYLERYSGLHFSLGLVELPIYELPSGEKLVAPRVLVRTKLVERQVVALPDGMTLVDVADEEEHEASVVEKEWDATAHDRFLFWSEFLPYLELDDKEQAIPKASRAGYLAFTLPAKGGWLTVYREKLKNRVGVFLSATRDTVGEAAMFAVVEDEAAILRELGGTAEVIERDGRRTVSDSKVFTDLTSPVDRHQAFLWLAERTNTFINVLRPRVRAVAQDAAEDRGALY